MARCLLVTVRLRQEIGGRFLVQIIKREVTASWIRGVEPLQERLFGGDDDSIRFSDIML